MKHVGVVIEGPSDFVFWNKVLGRAFAKLGFAFDIRAMKGSTRIIQEASSLCEDFRSAGYHSALFILDADKAECVMDVVHLFPAEIQEARKVAPKERFANIFVAVRELESWILADEVCVRALLGLEAYTPPGSTAPPGGKARFLRLCKEAGLFCAGMADRECARQAARFFEPTRAKQYSASFRYLWERLELRLL
jgi:hypothetical protein